jgi:hypothetical protein
MMRTKLTCLAAACAAVIVTASAVAQDKKDEHMMTYTGCVEPGKEAGSYMLTHVMMGAPGAEAKEGKAPKMLDLSSTSVKIAPHSGHKVTVMGKAMTEKDHTKLMVDSLKMVSTTCP